MSAIGRPLWRRLVILGVAMKVLGLAGLLIPRYLIRNGVEDYRDDPLAYATATDAYQGAHSMHRKLGAIVLPGARVRRVWRDLAHCRSRPKPDGPQADYRAEVRMYTWFGIPGPIVQAQCGGWAVQGRPSVTS
jgi:hypothetical protein